MPADSLGYFSTPRPVYDDSLCGRRLRMGQPFLLIIAILVHFIYIECFSNLFTYISESARITMCTLELVLHLSTALQIWPSNGFCLSFHLVFFSSLLLYHLDLLFFLWLILIFSPHWNQTLLLTFISGKQLLETEARVLMFQYTTGGDANWENRSLAICLYYA